MDEKTPLSTAHWLFSSPLVANLGLQSAKGLWEFKIFWMSLGCWDIVIVLLDRLPMHLDSQDTPKMKSFLISSNQSCLLCASSKRKYNASINFTYAMQKKHMYVIHVEKIEFSFSGLKKTNKKKWVVVAFS